LARWRQYLLAGRILGIAFGVQSVVQSLTNRLYRPIGHISKKSLSNMSDQEFLPIFMRNQDRIYRFIMTLVPIADEANEILQEVSMTLWRRWDEFDPMRGEFMPWALGIARNHIRNHVRKNVRRDQHIVFNGDLVDQLAEARIENAEIFDQQREALDQCLQKLTPAHRSLVQAFYSRQTSARQMALSYGLSKASLFRILRRIRDALFDCITIRLSRDMT
jgi:RNA polymerase sigma-70 factor (ECF subfamily)